jgi:uncharacterized membrane protein YgcG
MGNKMIVMILVTLMFLIAPTAVSAFNLTIPHAEIDAYLQEDGSVEVEESFTYEFDGDFNGVIRALNYTDYTAIENVEAYENGQKLEIETVDEYVHRIHRPGEDDTFTVDMTYTIENGVELYEDRGEFYWAFFDSSNETAYESMQIRVHPPGVSENAEAIGYGEAENTEEVTEDGYVLFDLGYVDDGENGDIRAAFDAALFTGVSRTSEGSAAEQIQQEKQDREESAAAFAERQDTYSAYGPFALSAFALLIFLIIFTDWKKYRHLKQEAYSDTLTPGAPDLQMSLPATMYYMRPAVSPELLTASLLDLVRQGKVVQEENESFRLVTRKNLLKHEEILVAMLFDDIAGDDVFVLSDLSGYLKKEKNYTTFEEKKAKWQKAVLEEKKEADLKINRTAFRVGIGLSAFLPLAASIVFILHGLVLLFVISLIMSFVILVLALAYEPRTVKGWKLLRNWTDYKKEISDYSLEDWKQLDPDDQKTAFIYGLGLNVKSMKKMSSELTATITAAQPTSIGKNSDLPVFMTAGLLASTQFKTSSAEAASSFSTSSGVTGGGSGVGGGGGGSGGF